MKKLDLKTTLGILPIVLLILSSLFPSAAFASYHFNKATTCKGVQTNYPYGPITETADFQDGETIYAWMEATNVYGSVKGKFEWIKPDGSVYGTSTTSTFHVTNGGWIRMYAPQLFYNTYGQWQVRFYISHNGGSYQLKDTKYCNYGGCVCPQYYDPVCGSDGVTYGNSCEAQCNGITSWTPGECNTGGGTTCDLLTRITFNRDFYCNDPCFKEIAVYEYQGRSYLVYDYRNGNCADVITQVVNCDTGANYCNEGGITGGNCGYFFDYAVKKEVVLECDQGCVCPQYVDPVCGSDGNTYNNSCEAECAGVTWTHGACTSGCACTNPYADYFCDDFQEYEPWQKLGPQSSCWTTWTGQEGGSKDGDVKRNNTTTNQYLKIKGNNPHGGGHQDVVLKLGDRTSGCYHLDFKIWLFQGDKGYYNILHKFTANGSNHDDEWACNVYFDGHGSGRLIVKNVAYYFTYKMGEWINVSQHFDLDYDLSELHIDGKRVHRWKFSNQATKTYAGTRKLSAIDFYPVNSHHEFYIDEVEFKKANNLNAAAQDRNAYTGTFGGVQNTAPLIVAPNPFENSINIQIPTEIEKGELMISDQLGRVIQQVPNVDELAGQTLSLDVSNLESGIYIVRIATRGKVFTQKIVKQSL